MDVLGGGRDGGDADPTEASTGRLGRFLASDGSLGAPVGLDLSRPHAGVVVGKRGSGKSYTLGVLAEELAAAPGVAPVVVDPMGAFGGLADAGLAVRDPRIRPSAVPPRAWCRLLDLDPAGGPGGLVWRAASERDTLDGMRDWVADCDARPDVRRAAANHLALAASWDCFGGERAGIRLDSDAGGVVLDCTRLRGVALEAVVHAVAAQLYESALEQRQPGGEGALPWLLVDEAHACARGAAEPAVETLYTRGRAPGASVVLATQRPSALPAVAVSQSDLVVAHRLTAGDDVDALRAVRPTYLDGSLVERLPRRTGDALVVDDSTETACTIRVRERDTDHGGGSGRVGVAENR